MKVWLNNIGNIKVLVTEKIWGVMFFFFFSLSVNNIILERYDIRLKLFYLEADGSCGNSFLPTARDLKWMGE